MNNRQTLKIEVKEETDVARAQRQAASTLNDWFSFKNQSDEVQLVIKELATNLVRHAKGGVIFLHPIERDGGTGVEIQSLDWGPGIAEVERAMSDHYSTAGGLGIGLGTINRLMDDMRIEPRAKTGLGTVITCRKWQQSVGNPTIHSPLQIGAASRPHPQMKQNGDAFVIKSGNDFTLLGVIDGLGHGQFAHRASYKARLFIENHCASSLSEIFRGVGYECRSTRGVVMTLVKIDWRTLTLSLAGIGNIETRLFDSTSPMTIPVKRGIIGQGLCMPRIIEQKLTPNGYLVMFSDGVASHWSPEDVQHLVTDSAQSGAVHILRKYGKDNDDATILVVKKNVP